MRTGRQFQKTDWAWSAVEGVSLAPGLLMRFGRDSDQIAQWLRLEITRAGGKTIGQRPSREFRPDAPVAGGSESAAASAAA